MTAHRRLFISSNFINLKSIFNHGNFFWVFKEFNSTPFCSYSPANNKFVAFPNKEMSTLFLINQDLNRLEDIVISDNDCLIYHDGHTISEISDLFPAAYCLPCHHEKFDPDKPIEFQAFAIALDFLLDNTIQPEKKAETIIERIWPDKAVWQKQRLIYLDSYFGKEPEPKGHCPDVFSKTTEMKGAFDELKKYKPGEAEYKAAFVTLRDLSFAHYYK